VAGFEQATSDSANKSAAKPLAKQSIRSAVDHISEDQQADAKNRCACDPSHEAAEGFFLNFGVHFAVFVVAHNCLLIRVWG
jgi:hypothetical protein